MPWQPSEHYIGGQLYSQAINNAANTIGGSVQEALRKWEQQKQENAYGSDMMQYMALQKRPDGTPYVPVEALQRYEASSSGKKAALLRSAQTQYAMDLTQQNAETETTLHRAQANKLEAEAHDLWVGGGDKFTVPQERIERGRQLGLEPFPTSANQVLWKVDPENPVNKGDNIDVRNVKTKDLGGGNVVLYDATTGKVLPPSRILRPDLMQQAQKTDALGNPVAPPVIGAAGGTAAVESPQKDSSATKSLPPNKVRIKGPDGKNYLIPAEQLQQALAQGATIAP